MEPIEAYLEEEYWGSLSRMFSIEQEASFMLHLHDHDSFWNNKDGIFRDEIPPEFLPNDGNVATVLDESFLCSDTSPNFYPTSSESAGVFCPSEGNDDTLSHGMHRESSGNKFPVFADGLTEEILTCLKEKRFTNELGNTETQPSATDDSVQIKRKFKTPETQIGSEVDNSFENPKKRRRRFSRDALKNKRNEESKSKKNTQKIQISNDEEETYTAGGNLRSSSSCSVEDDSSASQVTNGGETAELKGVDTVNSIEKIRASRGSATDPQSLYARKRRERINERLRILQKLVTNGTKVDISTMLEEAAHYVKFLQLQIKLLSSDDLWMYAPIAYNGMDICLHQYISPSP